MSQVIAIANEKGGVAKTTTCLSLGGALKEAGYDVLLIDLDAQGNLTLGTGISLTKVRRSTADMLLNAQTAMSVSRATGIPGLDIIPANADMGLAERFLPIRQNYARILREALAEIKLYDYILIDCPPSLGAVTLNALVAADRLLIPTQAEYFSAFALKNMLQLLKRVQTQENPGLDYQVLITMFDVRNRIHRDIREQIYARFGDHVLRTFIQVDTKLRESSAAGIPITFFARNSRSAHQYRALVQEITQIKATTQPMSALSKRSSGEGVDNDVKEKTSQPA